MKSGKWLFILLALCLVFSVTPARAFAGQTVSQTADQVQEKTVEKTVFEEISDTLAQAQGEPEDNSLRKPALPRSHPLKNDHAPSWRFHRCTYCRRNPLPHCCNVSDKSPHVLPGSSV